MKKEPAKKNKEARQNLTNKRTSKRKPGKTSNTEKQKKGKVGKGKEESDSDRPSGSKTFFLEGVVCLHLVSKIGLSLISDWLMYIEVVEGGEAWFKMAFICFERFFTLFWLWRFFVESNGFAVIFFQKLTLLGKDTLERICFRIWLSLRSTN